MALTKEQIKKFKKLEEARQVMIITVMNFNVAMVILRKLFAS